MPLKKAQRVSGTGELRVLQRLSPYEFGVELWLMREGVNQNKWDYRNLEKFYKTFVGQPILIAYVFGKVGDGHNSQLRTDPRTGEKYRSYMDGTAERIVGTLSDDERDFSLRKRDGQTWIVARGKLFAFYAKETVDEIVRTGRMDVSVETLIEENRMDGDIEIEEVWRGLGVTILGSGVAPAIPGANIARLAALNEEFKELKLKAASLQETPEKGGDPKTEKMKNKGVNTLKTYSKRQLAALAARFDGYKVLAAGEKDGKVYVCLMAKDGSYQSYVIENAAETIVPERFQNLSINAVMQVGEDVISMDCVELMEMVGVENRERLSEAEKTVKELKEQMEAAQAQVNAMQAFENKRRLNAAKKTANETLTAFNANRRDKVSESEIAGILTDVEAGLYTNCCDKDKNWTGEAEVAKAVYAVCGEAVQKMDAAEAAKNRTVYAWQKFGANNAGQDDGSIGALLSRLGIETVGEE